jgi:hypothetical protein
MRYLGAMSGSGMVKCDGEEVARASYEFEGYFRKPAGVTSSGEIQIAAEALQSVFGRAGVQLVTDEGRVLDLRFSENKQPGPADDVAHVEVTGDLPDEKHWRR